MHSATSQRNLTWPNCVKSILTHPLFLWWLHWFRAHGHCTHPSPRLMKVGTAPPILRQCSQHEGRYVHAFSASCACYSPVPLPRCHFKPISTWQCRTNALRIEISNNHAEAGRFGICQIYVKTERSHWRSATFLEDPEKRRFVLSETKCHENVRALSLPPKGFLLQTHFPDFNVREQWQIVYCGGNLF